MRPGVMLAALTGINLLNYFDRYVTAAVLPLVIKDLGISDARAGSLGTAFILVYAVASFAFGSFADRGHRIRLAALGVFVWSAATFGSGLAAGFVTLLCARALVGVGEASYAVVTPSLLADVYPAGTRGRVLAIFYAAIPVGTALSYQIGGYVGEHHGWRQAFFVAGGPGLAIAFLLLFMPEPPRGRYDTDATPVEPGLRTAIAALRTRPSYLFNTASQTIYTFTMGGLAYWMPTYFARHRGLSLERATFGFGLVLVLAGFAGTLVGGQLGDRLARRSPSAHFSLSGWALVLSTPFIVASLLVPAGMVYWPALFVTLFLLFLNTGPLNAAMANVLPPALRGRGFALYTLAIHVFGDAISPPLIGAASDRVGLAVPVLGCGLLLPIAGLVLLVGRKALARDVAQRPA